MAFLPIDDYGIIGNLRTAALIGKNGSIDWFPFPRFDSPSLFAAILDDEQGGYFRIFVAEGEIERKQVYWPDTNILVTRFFTQDGVGEITDFMPMHSATRLIRKVSTLRGTVHFRLECQPAFNYARDKHTTRIVHGDAHFHAPGLHMLLRSGVRLVHEGTGISAEFTLAEGKGKTFEFCEFDPRARDAERLSEQESDALFNETVRFWRGWLSKSTYRGRWREPVNRSALTLKLLTYEPTGAIVAAPTCSLPESLGGVRNWDYRYTWIRDSAFTVYSLMRLGFTDEAMAYAGFLDARCHELDPDGSLQTVYGLDGQKELKEETLDHLKGYRGSAPVRIGNAAYQQLQLDIYGEMMDSLYLYNKYGQAISYDLWTYLRRLTNWVCAHWRDKDDAIWEVRGGPRHFVYSKVMCWVAVDRAIRLAQKRSLPADWKRWITTRDQIYTTVMKRGWNEKRQAFVQSYQQNALDASLLLMPLVFFMSPSDPRMLQTIDSINKPPREGGLVSDGMVFRYDVDKTQDGLKGTEGTFNCCTFWLIEALTRASKDDPERLQSARLLFEQMLGYANHLGLYAEQTSSTGRAMGNFPLALTHLSMISAAFNLDRYLDGLASPHQPRT